MCYNSKLIDGSLVDMRQCPRDWWNVKHYIRKEMDNKNGWQEYVPLSGGEPEKPYERNPFHKGNGRFSLVEKEVAYFSSDRLINTCETLLRENYGEKFKDLLKPYFENSSGIENTMEFLLKYRLDLNARILDLREGSLAYKYFKNIGMIEVLFSDDYEPSIIVAEWAYNNGVHGITWRSVREPSDVNLCGMNLVIFDKNKVGRIA